jgi:uncharacterized cupredoxin-like copper-binding protein
MTRHDKSRAIARGTRGAATVAALLLLVACGGKSDTSNSNPAPAAPATSDSTDTSTPSAEPSPDASASSTPAGKATTVKATETEYSIKLSTTTFHAGSYTFAVTNSGSFKHALVLDGPGVTDKSTGDIAPGASGTVTVTLAKGTYDVYCPVGDHKSKGMDTKITVG